MSRTSGPRAASRAVAALASLALALLPAAPAAAAPAFPAAPAPAAASAAGRPAVALSLQEAAPGTELSATGTGWPARTLVMLLVCGQNMIGGTNSCANADGVAVTVADDGRFTARLPVAAPPKPCPCVVDVASVNGDRSTVAVPLKITGHPVADLPAESGSARLAMLTGVRLKGGDGVLTWFGAPPSRRLTATVGNLGSAPVKDPVFQLGTAHGVFAPQWEEARWKGTIPPGGKAEVGLDVELPAGAHGDYTVSLKYGETVLATQPWGVARPYGVLLFWGLLLVVVPTALFRLGMAVVDRVRPRPGAPGRHRAAEPAPDPAADPASAVTARLPKAGAAGPPGPPAPVLPWFTPDPPRPRQPRPPQTSAPSDHSPTTKGPQ